MLPIVLMSLLSALIVGVVLIALGLRGRRINDHPICRQCSFDLEGVYPEGVTCPECGAGLKREKSVRLGARRRRMWMVLVGALLALAPLPPIAAVAFAGLTGSDINAYKPLGLLLWEANHADSARTAGLAAEVLNRLMTPNKVTAGQYQRVIEATLALQADPSKAWSEEWGNIIDRAKLDGVLTQAQEDRFERQAGVLALKTRERVHAGRKLPVRIDLREARVSAGSAISWNVSLDGASVDGQEVARSAEPVEEVAPGLLTSAVWRMAEPGGTDGSYLGTFSLNGSRAPAFMGFSGGEPSLSLQLPGDLAPGRHRLAVDLEVDAQSGRGNGFAMMIINGRLQRGGAGATPRRVRVETEIEVVPAADPVVTAIAPDAPTTAKLAEALGVTGAEVTAPAGAFGEADGGAARMFVDFNVKDLPAPVAFDVYCRAGGKEWKLGTIDSGRRPARGDGSMFFSSMTVTINGLTRSSSRGGEDRRGVAGELNGFEGATQRVDIVLKPNPDAAEGTLDLSGYYNAEIVIPDVPVSTSVNPFEFDSAERMRQMIERSMLRRQRTGSGLGAPSLSGKQPTGPL
ncbi:hypothetical protein PHYC_03650 [Phycisphaerales bacterium]|nr:hypothetical protein PHYC_03650 [Phycisphaerales bacterium]